MGTAIFASFDSMAELLYLLLQQMSLRLPEDVSLVGFGGTVRRRAIASRLTSVATIRPAPSARARAEPTSPVAPVISIRMMSAPEEPGYPSRSRKENCFCTLATSGFPSTST